MKSSFVDDPLNFGRDINIVRMIEDHVPPRIDEINKELSTLQSMITELTTERLKLERLLVAVHDPTPSDHNT